MIYAEFTNELNDLLTENLYQWDTYQTLKISGIDFGSVAPKVHFANKKSTLALVVNGALQDDGSVEVSIPNSLLTEKYDILAYIYTNNGLASKTIKSITIPIISRLKPSEYYQPSDEDIAEIEKIELQAKNIINNLYGSEYDNTKKYTRPNIVYYNHSAYICNSNSEISGVLPTDTTKWVKIVDGAVVTNLSKDSNGNLQFIFSNGQAFTVEMAVEDVVLVDEADIPAINLTSDEVTKVKNSKALDLTDDEVKNCEKLRIQGTVSKDLSDTYFIADNPGLYSILVKDNDNSRTHTVIMSIPTVTGTVYYSTPLIGNYYVVYKKVDYDSNRWGFAISNASSYEILDVKIIMRY